MLYLTCAMISKEDLAHYGVARAKVGYLWIVVQELLTKTFTRQIVHFNIISSKRALNLEKSIS